MDTLKEPETRDGRRPSVAKRVPVVLLAVALLVPTVGFAASLDPRCDDAVDGLGGDDDVVVAELVGQTTGTVAMLGNLLCFVGDIRCTCLRAILDPEATERAGFLDRLEASLDACRVAEPGRPLSGVAQQAALEACPDDRETTTVSIFALSDGSGFVIEGSVAIVRATPTLGDDALDEEIRAFLTFPLDVVPAGAEVVGATLRVTETAVEGAPFDLGRVVVDHIDSGGVFDVEIFDGFDLESPIGGAETPVVLSSGLPLGQKSISVTDQVRTDRAAGRTVTQLRVRFDPGDSDGDQANDSLFLAGATLEIEFVE